MKYKNAVKIGRVEALQLCQGELPTSKKEIIISPPIKGFEIVKIVFKENGKYFFSEIEEKDYIFQREMK